MEGVNLLADCLFGLKLCVEPIAPGETWHPSVIKVGVYADGEYHSPNRDRDRSRCVGIVYCDLLDRAGKPAQVSLSLCVWMT